MSVKKRWKPRWALIVAVMLVFGVLAPSALADHDEPVTDDPAEAEEHGLGELLPPPGDPSAPLIVLDGIVSGGPFAKVTKNPDLRGRGVRNDAGATTDVWALGGYAYTGTFSSPCGGTSADAGIHIWDVSNKNKVSAVGVIASPAGSRSNDVKAASMNSGDILVHSNEPCDGGPGGFEIYDVDDPENPVHLALVTINESDLSAISPLFFLGGLADVGVHNLFLFTQGSTDYVAAVGGGAFDNFRIYNITDPTAPVLVSGWGAEEILDPGVGDLTLAEDPTGSRTLAAINDLFSGFGASQNKFLHDITISADGTRAYLANWDAGLVLLDISDPAAPSLVSVAIDPTSEDGEVNSHAVWPSEDGTIVIEGEEDFAPFATILSITSGPAAGDYPSAEGAFTTPIATLPGATMAGPTTYVGLACAPITAAPAGPDQIALIQRGACRFDLKATNAIDAGYDGMVVFNDAARGDAVITMGGDPRAIPGVFVGHSTGLAIAIVATAGDLVIDDPGESVSAAVVPDGWSGFRIWDYSDPTSPILASTFNTVCSADPVDPDCDPAGTYSAHNVIVESLGRTVRAYISWYTDGLLVLDISDPENPVEVARFVDASTNAPGVANDFWGVYKEPNRPWIYGSDRNGGLYVIKDQGAGSGK